MATVIGEFVAKIGADMKGFEGGLASADKKMGGFAKSIAKHRRTIGIGMTAMGGAILGGLGMATKAAADFEAGMREVNTMMGLGQEEFEAMSKDVLKLAKDLGINAVESTKALYQAISAGVPKENVLTFMEVAAKAAIGGVTDTETAVDGLTTVLNAFKMPMEDAQRVADIMFTTVKGGKTTFEELSSKMFNVAPIASATGIAFEEVAASIATMTKQGFPTAQATTAIRQAIVSLQKPTKEMAAIIDSLGFESGEAMIAELGFGKALDTLRDATEGSNELLMKMFGSVEAGGAVLALTGQNAEAYTADLEAMRRASDGAGASQEAFNEVERGASRQFEKAKESIKAVAIEIGSNLLPQLVPLIQKVGAVASKVSAWMEANPQLVGTLVKVVAVIGVLLTIAGPLLIMLPGIIGFLHVLGPAFILLTGPIGLVIAGIALLIAAGVLIWKNWDTIKAKVVEIWGAITTFFQGVWETIKKIFEDYGLTILSIMFPFLAIPLQIIEHWSQIKEFFVKVAKWIEEPIIKAVNAIVGFFEGFPEKIGKAFANVKDIILAPFRAAWKGIEAGINWLIQALNSIRVTIPDWIPGIGGKFFGINLPEVSLPSFKGGGVVPGSPGEPRLIMAHGGETISPRSTGDIHIHVAGSVISERDLGEIIREQLYIVQNRNYSLDFI